MGETISEYMQLLVNTIMFAAAISFLVLCLNQLSIYNKNQMKEMDDKKSIFVDNNADATYERIVIEPASVFTDVMSLDDDILNNKVKIDGISCGDLRDIKLYDISKMNFLISKIDMTKKYVTEYEYNDYNELIAVNYIKN